MDRTTREVVALLSLAAGVLLGLFLPVALSAPGREEGALGLAPGSRVVLHGFLLADDEGPLLFGRRVERLASADGPAPVLLPKGAPRDGLLAVGGWWQASPAGRVLVSSTVHRLAEECLGLPAWNDPAALAALVGLCVTLRATARDADGGGSAPVAGPPVPLAALESAARAPPLSGTLLFRDGAFWLDPLPTGE